MSSNAQIAANQANAQHSTGPRTAEGKAISSQNAVKHGLRSQDFVVAPEDQPEFDELREELRLHIQPDGGLTNFLFEKLLEAAWNQRRCRRAEAALRNELGKDPMQDPAGLKRLATIDRYSRRADRVFFTVLKEIRKVQTEEYYRTEVEAHYDDPALNPDLNLAGLGLADMVGADRHFTAWKGHGTKLYYRQLTNDIKSFEFARQMHNDKLAQTNPIAA